MSAETKINTIYGLAAILIWSTGVAVVRSLTESLGPMGAAAAVYLSGGGIGVLWLLARGKLISSLRSMDRRYLLICGGLFVFYMGCYYLALGKASNRSQAIEVGLINYLWPMLTVVFSILILRLKSKTYIYPGIIFACLGIYLANTQNQPLSWPIFIANIKANPVVYICGLLAAVSWGFYSVLSRKYAGENHENVISVFMLVTGLILGGISLFLPGDRNWSTAGIWELLYLAISTNLAYTFWDKAMRHGDIILVASLSYLLPLFSVLIATVYLKAPLTLNLVAGAVLVVLGAVLSRRSISQDI